MCSCSRLSDVRVLFAIPVIPDKVVAKVRLRQRVFHRRTFFYLEQLILKHGAAENAIRIKHMARGFDFFFNDRSHSDKFLVFLGSVYPITCNIEKEKSITFGRKYTYHVELCRIHHEDLICLPPRVAACLGDFGPLVICNNLSSTVGLLDPLTLRQCSLNVQQGLLVDPLTQKKCYLELKHRWGSFWALMSGRKLVKYIVLAVDKFNLEVVSSTGEVKYILADAQVARVSDFGKNNTTFYVKTHLGRVLRPGNHAFGYDLYVGANNDDQLNQYKGLDLPEVILVKKCYEAFHLKNLKKRQGKPRSWKLKSLKMEIDASARGKDTEAESEYEQFLRDLEENPDSRVNVAFYRKKKKQQPSEMASMTDGEELPSIPVDELARGNDTGVDIDLVVTQAGACVQAHSAIMELDDTLNNGLF